MLVWVDIETTGLDHDVESVLEVGMAITTDDLTVVTRRSMVILEQDKKLADADEIVRTMHHKSGLDELLRFGEHVDIADELFSRWLSTSVTPGTFPFCGSSIYFDRRILSRVMPKTEALFHYRSCDVSSVKEFATRWRPLVYQSLPVPRKLHRVDPDIDDTLNEARHYMKYIFNADL